MLISPSKFVPVALALSLSLTGCLAAQLPQVSPEVQVSPYTVKGTVNFGVQRTTQALITEVANAATVSLIDAGTGNTVGSSVTNASGSFVLSFSSFTPATGSPYILEAVKGLSVGGNPNRAGASAARLRTLLYWNGGWQSLTNATPGLGIMVSSSTTALAILTSLKKSAGINLDLTKLINTVSGSTFNEAGTGLSSVNDFQPVLGLVGNALSLDQDPVGAISFNNANNSYALPTGVPVISSISPTTGTPGGTVTIKGAYLDAMNGRNTFWFGTIPASTWSVSADRTTATVPIPATAYSAPFTLQQLNGVVQTLDPFYKLHGTVGTLAGNGAQSFGNGVGINAQFNHPSGVALDSSGNLYAVEAGSNLIRKITPGGIVTTLAGSGGYGHADGTGTAAIFAYPTGIAVDNSDNLYIADMDNNRIRKITPGGIVTTLAGSGVAGSANGTGTAAQFYWPHGLTLDGDGNVYVADYGNHLLRKITPAGVVTTIAGTGTAGYVEGATTSAQFSSPTDVAVDASGNLYVLDRSNQRIRKISGGTVSTLAGSGVAGFFDGIGSAAQLNWPRHIIIDSSGNLYVGDSGNGRLRKVTPAGMVTTIAGSGIAGYAEGATSSAQFDSLQGLALNSGGNIFIGDFNNNRIRVVIP